MRGGIDRSCRYVVRIGGIVGHCSRAGCGAEGGRRERRIRRERRRRKERKRRKGGETRKGRRVGELGKKKRMLLLWIFTKVSH